MTSTVEPAPAVSIVVVVPAVSVVAARSSVLVVLTATTRAKGDACDYQYNHYYHNNKDRSH